MFYDSLTFKNYKDCFVKPFNRDLVAKVVFPQKYFLKNIINFDIRKAFWTIWLQIISEVLRLVNKSEVIVLKRHKSKPSTSSTPGNWSRPRHKSKPRH